MQALKEGTDPYKVPQSHPARQYASLWSNLSLFDEHPLLVYDSVRIIVPKAYRKKVLDLLHRQASHKLPLSYPRSESSNYKLGHLDKDCLLQKKTHGLTD